MTVPAFHALSVHRISPEAEGAVILTLTVPEALRDTFRFEPGQFVTLRARVNGQDLRRSYSISSPRSQLVKHGEVTLGIRPVEGGVFSNWAAAELKAGDTLRVMPPTAMSNWSDCRSAMSLGQEVCTYWIFTPNSLAMAMVCSRITF